jgi:multiple sugar transport system substrate-binding protein
VLQRFLGVSDREARLAIETEMDRTLPDDFEVQMKQAALRGNPPTRRSVFTDPELRARFRAFPAQLASLDTARPRPRTPLWNEIENAFGIRISQANSGSITPEEALQRANQEIEAIVQRAK